MRKDIMKPILKKQSLRNNPLRKQALRHLGYELNRKVRNLGC